MSKFRNKTIFSWDHFLASNWPHFAVPIHMCHPVCFTGRLHYRMVGFSEDGCVYIHYLQRSSTWQARCIRLFKGEETNLTHKIQKCTKVFFFWKLAPFLPFRAIFRTTLHQDECNAFHATFEIWFVTQARQINQICTHGLLRDYAATDSNICCTVFSSFCFRW